MVGEILHFEIPAKNPAKLSKFYSDCFGWKFKDSGIKGMKYWLIQMSGSKRPPGFLSSGGMYKKTAAGQMQQNYIRVANVDAALKRLKAKGGKVLVGKQEIPGMGWSALALDIEGNPFGVFQPMKMPKKR